MTFILGFDTSGGAGSAALWRDDHLLGQRALDQEGRRHAQTLVSECAALLAELDLRPEDLSAIAATRGPGSFTGLRVGVVCAKTLAYSLQIPLITLDTFDVIAAQCPTDWSRVWIVDDAQRQELFVGRYESLDGKLRLTGERFIVPARHWLSSLAPQDIVTGPGALRLPDDIVLPVVQRQPEFCVPRAETVCRLAAVRLARNDVDDVWAAAPFYIRVSGAEEKAALKQFADAKN
ncbi:MAG: tRNA (adenosine(37)-N6)-threonylcarbamoyltransferase complex dimerization subunit type 1 TsaB [Planctomycetaceae bacterium]